MVAVLLRLRFRVLANTLQRNTIQLIAVIVGSVSTIGLLAMVLGGLFFASVQPPEATQAAVIVGGSALVLGWLVVPLLFDGVDRTLEPLKLARFPLRTDQLMTAMFLVGVTWIPGIATLLASVGTVIAWRNYPLAAAAAVASGVVGTVTCIVGSRLMTSAAGTLLRGRRAPQIGIALVIVLAFIVPLASAPSRGPRGRADGLLIHVNTIVDTLSWTPLGAVWSIPGHLALGEFVAAGVATAIAIGSLAGLLVLWHLTIDASLRVRGDGPLHAAKAGRLGVLGWLPATPIGAITARSLIYWFRDARLSRQLVLIPVLPALMLLWWTLFHIDGIAIAIGPIVASLLPLSVFAGLSYDGTAYAAELAAGVRGLHDRIGRALALVIVAVPASVAVQVAVSIVIGRVDDLPAMLGLTLGTLLVSVGVVSVSSARIVVPVARAGRNPFSSQAGAATVSIAGSYAVTGVTSVLTLPIAALAIVALVIGSALLGWLALLASLVIGGAVAFAGSVVGGRMLDASGPEVLSRLRLIR